MLILMAVSLSFCDNRSCDILQIESRVYHYFIYLSSSPTNILANEVPKPFPILATKQEFSDVNLICYSRYSNWIEIDTKKDCFD